MILVLGKGISGEGAHHFLKHFNIEHDYLALDEVKRDDYELVIKSPGIPYQNEYIKKMLKKNVKIITDVELISMILTREFIGITGTNGKTTTTTLIYEGLKKQYEAICCGNIGVSIGEAALNSKRQSLFVVELSSFELMGVKNFKPHIAIILNLESAHMDYHENMEQYLKAKLRITENQKKEDYLIYNYDAKNLKDKIVTNATIRTFSLDNEEASCYIKKGYIYYFRKKQIKIKDLDKTSKYNYLSSYIALRLYGISNAKIRKVFKDFKGIPHRLEKICNDIYNDAKATNPSATIYAIKKLDREVILICGGYNRGEDLEELIPYLSFIKKVYTYGMTANIVYKFMKKHQIPVEKKEKLSELFPKVLKENKGKTILYSPMFASYDQYRSFEERGEEFTYLVKKYHV